MSEDDIDGHDDDDDDDDDDFETFCEKITLDLDMIFLSRSKVKFNLTDQFLVRLPLI